MIHLPWPGPLWLALRWVSEFGAQISDNERWKKVKNKDMNSVKNKGSYVRWNLSLHSRKKNTNENQSWSLDQKMKEISMSKQNFIKNALNR